MSDTAVNKVIQWGTQAERLAFVPNPAVGSRLLYIWYETDNSPDVYMWDPSGSPPREWVPINPPHASTHENGGSDEIDVTGLAGLLADPQTPLAHNTSHQSGGPDPMKLDDLAAPDDNADLDASTSTHGLLVKATAPAAGLQNVPAIRNGETAYTNRAMFDTTNPAALGTAGPGTELVAARRDHIHTLPKLDDLAAPDDNTDLDVSTTKHGLAPKAPNDATKYLDGQGNYTVPAGTAGGGSLVGRQVITATGAGTYTPTSGTTKIVIELLGGGGGGGGSAQPGSGNAICSRAGGGGGWLTKRLTANFSGAGYVVGAKGTGGTAGANNGNAGSDTTFTDTAGSPTTYTAAGGTGGLTGAATAPPFIAGSTAGGGTTNAEYSRPGGAGQNGFALSTTQAMGSRGGHSMYAPGANAQSVSAGNTSAAGNAAGGFGGGGGGGVATGTGAAAAGGDGSDGLIVIWEYA